MGGWGEEGVVIKFNSILGGRGVGEEGKEGGRTTCPCDVTSEEERERQRGFCT